LGGIFFETHYRSTRTGVVVDLASVDEVRGTDLDERLIIENVQLCQRKPTDKPAQCRHDTQMTHDTTAQCPQMTHSTQHMTHDTTAQCPQMTHDTQLNVSK